MKQTFRGYMTDSKVAEARVQSYEEGWNDALFKVLSVVESNPNLTTEDIINKIKNMGR